jgi:1-deoxy-D-xylulose-5-phosphate synthase
MRFLFSLNCTERQAMGLLENILSPADIKNFNAEQRCQLAAEARELIIRTVSDTGGHLATNLGTVELTIAVHTVFDAPGDQLVWDTGHNAYTHKLLTGRASRFHTLRQAGGLSGFLRRDESLYDTFGAGHAATSVSAAAGMALARDIRGGKEKVVAIIGDSSIPNGMSFEALNHLGHARPDALIILNDNDMSISAPVGGVSKYLARLVAHPGYNKVRKEAQNLLKRLPGNFGEQAAKWARRGEEMAKGLMAPGMLFEELGFLYIGPVDGHDTETLIEILREVRNLEGPVLLHCVTTKGKGFKAAEQNPVKFHGAAHFDPRTGEPLKPVSGPPSWSQAFADLLHTHAVANPWLTVITPAMTSGSSLERIAQDAPRRFFDVGIAEEHAVTLAAGMAARGLRPVVCIYSTFLQRAYDQAAHDVALQNLPVIFAMDRSGLVGDDGPTHHGVLDIAFMRSIPGMTLMAPSDATEMAGMLNLALRLDGPSCLRIPRGGIPSEPGNPYTPPLPLAKGRVCREGLDVALISYGRLLPEALKAAAVLEKEGIQARVVDARFAKPLDASLMADCARQCKAMVTIEEGTVVGGFGSAVLESLAHQNALPKVFEIMGVPDKPIEHGSPQALLAQCGLDVEGIVQAARRALAAAKA